MPRDEEFRAKEKKYHKMTHDGLIERGAESGEETRISTKAVKNIPGQQTEMRSRQNKMQRTKWRRILPFGMMAVLNPSHRHKIHGSTALVINSVLPKKAGKQHNSDLPACILQRTSCLPSLPVKS